MQRRILNYVGILLIAAMAWPVQSALGTHLRAGEITATRVSCTSLEFIITITVYTDTGTEIRFGDGILDFGDGSEPHQTPTIENTLRPDLGPEIGTVTYSINHVFPAPGAYVISYLEPNRNQGILNMFNSVETRFYLETLVRIDAILGCSNTPRLLVPPIDKACTGAAWFHNPGAFDPDGDSISFELAIPKKEKGLLVDNYRPPHAKEFYDKIGLDYNTANETQDGQPTFTIDPVTGTIVWDAPGAPGEYNIAFIIKEWRNGVLLGYVTRDMQIVVEDCLNQRPELEVPEDICVEAGTLVNEEIFGTDPDLMDSVKIEAFSQVLIISPSPATYASPNPPPSLPKFQGVSPDPAKLTFTWQTECAHIKDQPYQVVFKITDKPAEGGVRLVSFKTWNIRVVGPAPVWNDAQVDLNSRSANLSWDSYQCPNAEIMQIWRRVDKFEFTPPECVTGMPEFLGFTLIDEVPIGTTSYTDTNNGKGLAVGAQYCYRLVAKFPLPSGGESYVSQDTCLAPILADAPVITNVTVDKTSTEEGEITVKWRSPFDINPAQFPPPYTYEVYRAEGFTGANQIIKPHTGRLTDSTFIDLGLNTEEIVYNYRIVCYDNNETRVDTSFIASSVRLDAKSQLQRIELTWAADVPWSIMTQDFSQHYIYRGSMNDTESDLVLIDSVDVNVRFFNYIDSGQYNNTPLLDTEVYCYRVMTRGSYGNPEIEEPLINYSQIICAQPNDSVPPCQPQLEIIAQGCVDYIQNTSCAPSTFSNTIIWRRPEDLVCRADVRSYNIYIAPAVGAEFELYVTNVRDTFYVDANLPSFARCYKIAAVDRSGNVSELSEEFCFDNCPHYELPNVFTPNGDNCNELFSAFSDRAIIDENGEGPCGEIDILQQRRRCARFVEQVHFVVYNRWGKEVYNYSSGGERSIYIDWDGRDDSGQELSAGNYFYITNVTFDVVEPSQRKQVIKGWVHLIR
jgi:hypothetical protein